MDSVVALQVTPIADKLDADQLVKTIEAYFSRAEVADQKGFQLRVTAGIYLLEAKERVRSGEFGAGVKWLEWCKQNITNRSIGDIQKCMSIASDPSSARLAIEERDKARIGMAKMRARRAAEPVVAQFTGNGMASVALAIVPPEVVAKPQDAANVSGIAALSSGKADQITAIWSTMTDDERADLISGMLPCDANPSTVLGALLSGMGYLHATEINANRKAKPA